MKILPSATYFVIAKLEELSMCKKTKINWHSYGFDIWCDDKKILLRPISRNGIATITFRQYIEARRDKPQVLFYYAKPSNNLFNYALLDWSTVDAMIKGITTRKILIMTEPEEIHTLRIKVIPKKFGKTICIVVDKKTFKKWQELLWQTKLPPHELFERLLHEYL